MIRLRNVSKFYYSKGMISSGISRVNLDFHLGEFVVITGESGGGKTTLLNVISGLDSYEEGELYINGEETSHYQASDFEDYRKKYIGNIFQNFNLVNSYTVYQNVELILLINGYTKEEIKKRVPAIISQVGLEEHAKTKVSKLSGGQKQRVAIARALAKDTDIIVADEPTGNLDSVSAEGIARLLSDIAKDKLVIVVTHNYDQFAPYATRKIKMHDGKVAEDERLKETEPAVISVEKEVNRATHYSTDHISAANKVRLGVRNTFNIIPKFVLMLMVFLFVVFAVTSQYTTYRHQAAEEQRLGYNDYFYNYSEERVVLKKVDGSAFTEDDFTAIRNAANVKSVAGNDIMLDTGMYIESDEFSYETYPHVIGEFEGEPEKGRLPVADNEALLTVYPDDFYFDEAMIDEVLGSTYKIWIGEDKEITVAIVGFAYKPESDGSALYTGDLYLTDQMMSTMLTETYNYNSIVKTTINGKEMTYEPGDPFYRIVPSSKVDKGEAVGPEEITNFYENGEIEGKDIKVTAENIYYTQSVTLEVAGTYTKKTFADKTGFSDFDVHNGTVYINQADYDTLFSKGNYQASVYVEDVGLMEETLDMLSSMGYVTLPLKDTLIPLFDEITSIVKVPMTVIMMIALFFIAYFVIRVILKSRVIYFSILRMLGMARRNIRHILDVEMLLLVNIAYGLFIACIAVIKSGLIHVQYIMDLVEYMRVVDFAVLYVVVLAMAYMLSGKFARTMFRKTAMGNQREED